jgi:hypothetical protein
LLLPATSMAAAGAGVIGVIIARFSASALTKAAEGKIFATEASDAVSSCVAAATDDDVVISTGSASFSSSSTSLSSSAEEPCSSGSSIIIRGTPDPGEVIGTVLSRRCFLLSTADVVVVAVVVVVAAGEGAGEVEVVDAVDGEPGEVVAEAEAEAGLGATTVAEARFVAESVGLALVSGACGWDGANAEL